MTAPKKNKEVPETGSPTHEQRALKRIPGCTVGPIQLRTQPDLTLLSADVHDVSIQGIGIVANQSFSLGTSFKVEGGPSGKALPMELIAVLRHATMLPNGHWLLGCSFSRYLTAADLEVLG